MTRAGGLGRRWAPLGVLLLVVATGVPAGAQEQSEDFYRNQTIRIMVNATGGGFDVSARALARHLGRHIPGNPAAVVETMSGAGGLVAANYLYRGRQAGRPHARPLQRGPAPGGGAGPSRH